MTLARKIPAANAGSSSHNSSVYSLELLARRTDGLRLFANCVEAAGLAGILASKGPFTIFAPTDDAFEKLPAGVYEVLLRDAARLKAIINYHTTVGFVPTREMKSGDVMTLQGSALAMAVSGDAISVNGAAIIEADLSATNGTIHSIAEMLLPPKWRLPSARP
jgi:uncharacterized surface protein with fasciclin (FAS1) repeats